jgi:type I restriction enzyme S subunit
MSFTSSLAEIIAENANRLLGKHGGWERVRLAEIASVQNGAPFPSELFSRIEGFPLLRIRDILTNTTEARFTGEIDPLFIVEPGDLVIGMDGDFNSALWSGPRALLNQRVCRIKIDECHYSKKFLACVLPGYLSAINQKTSSITVKHLSSRTIEDIPLPLPSLREQERIVAKLEQYFSQLDSTRKGLLQIRAKLKRYRASILRAACEGRLVPTEAELARREGRGFEAADQLIRRAQRRQTSLDVTHLTRLPEGWAWSSIGDLFYVSVGATPSRQRPDFWGGDVAWVTSGEIAFRRISKTREQITQAGLRHTSTECHPPGTVLLAMIGEGKTRGQVAILDVEACNNQNSAAIRVAETEMEPGYVYYFLWSEYERTRRLGSGNNQPALNKSRVQAILIPVPPISEQRRIVQELERQLSVLDGLQRTVQDGLIRAGLLSKLILKEAFQGRLVPQDPNDEPAALLLERIRQAKASQTQEPRARKQRTKPAPPPPAREKETPSIAEPEPQEADFLELSRDQQVEIVWETLFGQGMLEKETAIRTVAEELRSLGLAQFKRLRQDGALYNAVAAAIDRGAREGSYDRRRRGSIRAVLHDPKEYTVEDWQRCLLTVTGPEPADLDTTLLAAAEWARETLGLEFARLREDGVILNGLRDALEIEVKAGRIIRRGRRVRRG